MADIISLDGSACVYQQPAQLDTAADRTVVPSKLLESLGIVPTGQGNFQGIGGRIQLLDLCRVSIALPTFDPIELEGISHPDEAWILLGRDLLNL